VPVIDIFAPGLRQVLEKNLRLCPLRGEFIIDNYTLVAETYPTINPVGYQTRTNIELSSEKLIGFINCYVYSKVY
jgi:hypothetical protein